MLFALAAGPVRSKSGPGSSYLTSAVNNNCSGRFTATVFSFDGGTVAKGSSTGNSSSKLSSSSSSSSTGEFHWATTGDSKGGVSVISKSVSTFSERSGLFDHNQLLADVILVNTSLTGVAVITSTPKTKMMKRTGYVKTDVIKVTRGVETAYPSQPPPWRIAVAPVPIDPLNKWANPVVESKRANVPIMIRPVAFESSGTRNNLKAK